MNPGIFEQFDQSIHDSIFVEVEMGITFARIALDANGSEKRERNRRNARKAYDTAVLYVSRYPLQDGDAARHLQVRFRRLRYMLFRLGERFEA